MNILYISTLLPKSALEEVYRANRQNYVAAPQKFHRTVVRGLMENGHDVKVLTVEPAGISLPEEMAEDGIAYIVHRSGKEGVKKHIDKMADVYRQVRRLRQEGWKADVMICDSLNIAQCLGAFRARLLSGIKVAAIVTDLHEMSNYETASLKYKAAREVSKRYMRSFDCYVLLTEQMNERVNRGRKPYIVMEGICDEAFTHAQNTGGGIRRLFYAGGRPQKDGADMLVRAFRRLEDPNLSLDIYGPTTGLKEAEGNADARVRYHGIVENSRIVAEERRADLLINPRPNTGEYTKYSFPSKIMEYMASGSPLVSTRLAGIPEEYYDYIYTFDQCTEDEYYAVLKGILDADPEDVKKKGEEASRFVAEKKNRKVQTRRIVEMIKGVIG